MGCFRLLLEDEAEDEMDPDCEAGEGVEMYMVPGVGLLDALTYNNEISIHSRTSVD